MTRMSKAKREKLESIMSLVEQLGIDRVLGRLQQTKMMSREVLDDMKEWETDYEKRMALLGFLVAPEGKSAFGALYELSKVHEEQLKFQEEQEKLRQEQLARQSAPDLKKFGRGSNSMKMKLRQQLAKRKDPPQSSTAKQEAPPSQPQAQQIVIPTPTISKTGKRTSIPIPKKPPPKEPASVPEPVIKQVSENAFATTTEDQPKPKPKEKLMIKERKPPSPIQGISPRNPRGSDFADNGLDLSLTGSAAIPPSAVRPRTVTPPPAPQPPQVEEPPTTEREQISHELSANDGQWGQNEQDESDASEAETQEEIPIEADRPLPDGENEDDAKEKSDGASVPTARVKKVRISDAVTVLGPPESTPSTPSTAASTPILKRRKVDDIHQKLLSGEISVDELSMDQIKEIVADWQNMKRDRGSDDEHYMKELQNAKEELKKSIDEKDRIRKEKDRYVFKEFELQQKLQDQSQRYKSLKDDHESLKLGHYQSQISSRKSTKVNQDMKKKIAKLESKIKSYDKVTVRKGTQTIEVFDKDVHESLRTAEESLQVTQSELKEALAKSKTSQQEVDDLKKQLNAKGREINKRERKSKKDEDSIRSITRDRDLSETKLRKVTEQLEYYKGMLDIRTKGGKRQTPEKKEVRVQRCSSGRHIVLKTQSAPCQQKDEDSKTTGKDNDGGNKTSTKNGAKASTGSSLSRQTKPTSQKQTSSQPSKTSSESASSNTKTNHQQQSGTSTNVLAKSAPTTEQKSTPKSIVKVPSVESKQGKSNPPKTVASDSTAETSKQISQNDNKTQPAVKESSQKPPSKPVADKSSNEKPVRPKAATVRTTKRT